MSERNGDLVSTEVRARKVVFYLATESDLRAVDENHLLGGISVTLAAAFAGGLLSALLSLSTGPDLTAQSDQVLVVLCGVLGVASAISTAAAVYFYMRAHKTVKTLRESGQVRSVTAPGAEPADESQRAEVQTPSGSGFEIVSGRYWTPNASLDVTAELAALVRNGRLETVASNALEGDPDEGTVKTLTIRYRIWGAVIEKEFLEGERVSLP
ncbi:MAG: hypothetical protein WBJ62_05535 [Coriobacteriia bacterium]